MFRVATQTEDTASGHADLAASETPLRRYTTNTGRSMSWHA
ncbi:MAG: hypothetical protein J07HQX50_02836, partial [Haloquadratum sp. J07HQX50]